MGWRMLFSRVTLETVVVCVFGGLTVPTPAAAPHDATPTDRGDMRSLQDEGLVMQAVHDPDGAGVSHDLG